VTEAEASRQKIRHLELLSERATPGSALGNYAAVLELWDDIAAAREKGWSYREIWRTLDDAGAIAFSYNAFVYYLRKRREALARSAGGGAAPSSRPGANEVKVPAFGDDGRSRKPRTF
jgi:hypothetical protein